MPVERRKRDINERSMLILSNDSLLYVRDVQDSLRVKYMIAKTNYILSLLAITTQ